MLLAGGGDTAHVFDDFAPKLKPGFHVYGITRRGFGQSGFSPEGWGADRGGDDVFAVLDAPVRSSLFLDAIFVFTALVSRQNRELALFVF